MIVKTLSELVNMHLFQYIIWMENDFEIQWILAHVSWIVKITFKTKYIKETGNLFHIDISFHVYNSWHFLALEGARNTVQWGDLCSSQKTTRTPPGGKRLKLARKTLRIAVNSCNYIFTWAEFFYSNNAFTTLP